jgi:uncharacterized protein (TIGR04168 family)
MLRDSSLTPIQIAVVGDVHDAWSVQDQLALHHLGVDLVLFVGDFGNEAVDLVNEIATLNLPYAAVLGNHDAWYTATPWGRQKCPYDRHREDRVQVQLTLLGAAHVGYGSLDFADLGLSVVGGRPFSWGGPEWRYGEFYLERFGVADMVESTARITTAATASTQGTVIFLSHNGPAGLGDHPEAACGRDWPPLGGDFGDPDLEGAIAAAKASGKKVPLVAFGHMHHQLRHTKVIQRQRLYVDRDGTVYLNAACVPRVIPTDLGEQRNFSLVTVLGGQVIEAQLVWVDQNFDLVKRTSLCSKASRGI